jgi:4-hydroxythreonine-4-phosphate dehydrogenase
MRIGFTLGDPAGIGPELCAAALARGGVGEVVVYGDRRILEEAAARMQVTLPRDLVLEAVTELAYTPGVPSPETGRAQVAYLEAAVTDAKRGRLSALVTAPIHKASCLAAGFAFPGHTEFLAARLSAERVTMMFAGPRMRVSLATIHCALAAVPGALSIDGLRGTIVQTGQALVRWFGLERPRLAVAGLNPHAGEGGHFGDEEARIIAPAIAAARAELPSVILSGPHVPDVVFREHSAGRYDAVVALYHDQGLIPVKVVDFDAAVNVTLGLPIVRTSPDHGVAHDIAGKGTARTLSFLAAVDLAHHLAS